MLKDLLSFSVILGIQHFFHGFLQKRICGNTKPARCIQTERNTNIFTTTQYGLSASRCYIEMVRKVRETYCFIYIKKDKLWLLYISVGRLPKSDWHMLIRNLCCIEIDLSYWSIGHKLCITAEASRTERGWGSRVDRLVRQRNLLFLLLWHKWQVLRGDITNTEICTLLKIWIMTLVSLLDRKVFFFFFFFNKSNIWILRELCHFWVIGLRAKD